MHTDYLKIGVLALLFPLWLSAGPNPQLKITIQGGGLAAPIEVFDKDLLTRFFFGAGPGNSGPQGTAPYWATPSFIVDWPRGETAAPSKTLPAYEVEFLTSRTDLNTYRVTYAYDAATHEGYVFLPGQNDPRYRENTWLLLRGVEGKWFHAWSQWNSAVRPLLTR